MSKVLLITTLAFILGCNAEKPAKENPAANSCICPTANGTTPNGTTLQDLDRALHLLALIRHNFESADLYCRTMNETKTSNWNTTYELIYDCHIEYMGLKADVIEVLQKTRGIKPEHLAEELIDQIGKKIDAYDSAVDCFLEFHEYDVGWKHMSRKQAKGCLAKIN